MAKALKKTFFFFCLKKNYSYEVIGLCLNHRESQIPGEVSVAVGLEVFVSDAIVSQTLDLILNSVTILWQSVHTLGTSNTSHAVLCN